MSCTRENGDLSDLIDALGLAAAEARLQEQALPIFRRLAAEIRDGHPVALLEQRLARENVLSEEARALVQRVDEIFDLLVWQDQGLLFSREALHRADLWRELRSAAREALKALGA